MYVYTIHPEEYQIGKLFIDKRRRTYASTGNAETKKKPRTASLLSRALSASNSTRNQKSKGEVLLDPI
jgi:hypothetical protein